MHFNTSSLSGRSLPRNRCSKMPCPADVGLRFPERPLTKAENETEKKFCFIDRSIAND